MERAMKSTRQPATMEEARRIRRCHTLLERWDPMFSESVDPTRRERVDAILGCLRSRFPGSFRVLDLGTGPGVLPRRILEHFPNSRVVALDTDPVRLRIGEAALHRYRGRVSWVLADLRDSHWVSGLPVRRFDAVVSSLALHWLEGNEIRRIYREVRPHLRPGGLLLNADFLPSSLSTSRPAMSRRGVGISRGPPKRSVRIRQFQSEWAKWWGDVAAEPSLRAALRERQLRLPGPMPPRRTTGPRNPVSLESHQRLLRSAGFRDSRVIWQDGNFRALLALR
jgi:SAM-dependent methyltransferase